MIGTHEFCELHCCMDKANCDPIHLAGAYRYALASVLLNYQVLLIHCSSNSQGLTIDALNDSVTRIASNFLRDKMTPHEVDLMIDNWQWMIDDVKQWVMDNDPYVVTPEGNDHRPDGYQTYEYGMSTIAGVTSLNWFKEPVIETDDDSQPTIHIVNSDDPMDGYIPGIGEEEYAQADIILTPAIGLDDEDEDLLPW